MKAKFWLMTLLGAVLAWGCTPDDSDKDSEEPLEFPDPNGSGTMSWSGGSLPLDYCSIGVSQSDPDTYGYSVYSFVINLTKTGALTTHSIHAEVWNATNHLNAMTYPYYWDLTKPEGAQQAYGRFYASQADFNTNAWAQSPVRTEIDGLLSLDDSYVKVEHNGAVYDFEFHFVGQNGSLVTATFMGIPQFLDSAD